jgi:hypothetical protein
MKRARDQRIQLGHDISAAVLERAKIDNPELAEYASIEDGHNGDDYYQRVSIAFNIPGISKISTRYNARGPIENETEILIEPYVRGGGGSIFVWTPELYYDYYGGHFIKWDWIEYSRLGVALMEAERAEKERIRIEAELECEQEKKNDTKELSAVEEIVVSAPEPTTEEKFVLALKDLISENWGGNNGDY